MKSITLAATLTAALGTQSALGWTLTYRDRSGRPHIIDGQGNRGCTRINHARGKLLEWDRPTFSNCCVRVWENGRCAGPPQGFSCPDWRKVTTIDLNSFMVTNCS
jgi:hypothetical protein